MTYKLFIMLAMKLRPAGRKGQRSFRVVVVESRSKLLGKFVEDLGWENRHTDEVRVNAERAKYWLSHGASPTDSVHNVLVRAGVIPGPKIPVHKVKPKAEQPAPEVSVPTDSSEVADASSTPVG